LTVLCTASFHLHFVTHFVLDSRPRYVRVNTLALKVHAALKIFCDEGWKQVGYNRKAEDYVSFLRRVASLADDEFIQDLHVKELLIFPHKTEFYKHPLYLDGCIILQDKVRLTF
jgi:putative methyltransferase